MSPQNPRHQVPSDGRDSRVGIALGFFVLFVAAGLGILFCTSLRPELCLRRTGLVTVGEVRKMRVGQTDWMGDCRPDPTVASRFKWRVAMPQRSYAWQRPGPTIEVQTDGTVRGLAPGAYAVVGQHGGTTEKEEGVVLPANWTMNLEPEDLMIEVGQSVRYRVRVLGPDGDVLDRVPFSIFPEIGEQIVRGPGLVSSDKWVEFRAIAPGRTTITGYVGDHSVTTSLTVVDSATRDR